MIMFMLFVEGYPSKVEKGIIKYIKGETKNFLVYIKSHLQKSFVIVFC